MPSAVPRVRGSVEPGDDVARQLRGLGKRLADHDAGKRWVIERTNSWHNHGFKKLAICTERRTRVIAAFIALANAVIITRRLLRQAWTTHRWDSRPDRRP